MMRRNSYVNLDNPLLWLLSAWGVALFAWAMAPDELVYFYVSAGRHKTISSFAFLVLFIGLLCLGMMLGRKWKRPVAKFLPSLHSLWTDEAVAKKMLPVLLRVSRFLVFVGVGASILQIFAAVQNLSSVTGLFRETYMLREEFQGGGIQGLTILKFISLPGFILATIGHSVCKKWHYVRSARRFRFLQILPLINPAFKAFLGSRLHILLWIIPYIYVRLGIFHHLKRRQYQLFRFARYGIALVTIFILLFATGFYLRHYSRVSTGHVVAKKYVDPAKADFANYGILALASYPFRTINNALVIVDYVDEHTLFYRLFRWAYSGFDITEIDPGGLIAKLKLKLLYLQWMGLGCFGATNSSLPGFMYMDLGWFSLILSFFLGFIIARLYNLWLATDLCGWVVMPVVLVGLLDSWRTDILFRSVTMLAIVSGVVACIYINRRAAALVGRA